MHKTRQLLTILLLTIATLAFAARVEEKLLFTIQDKAEKFQLPGITNQVVPAPGQHGGKALQVTYPKFVENANQWPSVYFRSPDISPVSLDGWDGFVITVYNPLSDQVDLGISINGDLLRAKHFGKHVMLQPNTWNHFLLPVAEFAEQTGGKITSFDFFMTQPAQEFTLFYDSVKLVKRNPPDETVLPSVVTLADFESAPLAANFECNGMTCEPSEDWAHDGKRSIRLKFTAFQEGLPPWPSFQFYASDDPVVGFDWSAFCRLEFTANYTGSIVLPLRCNLRDAHGSSFVQEATLNPGQTNTVSINLADTGLDLRHIQQVDLYLSRPFYDFEVEIDTLQLVASGTAELAGTQSQMKQIGEAISLVSPAIQAELLPQYRQLTDALATAMQTATQPSNTMRDLRQMADVSLQLQNWLYRNSRRLDEALICEATSREFPEAPFGVAIADSMTKVMIGDLPLADVSFAREVQLELARNEYESFQIVAVGRPEAPTAIAEVNVTTLKQGDYELPADAVAVSLVGHVECKRPPYAADYQGWYPDPLLDFRNNAPVAPREAVAFWVRVKTPADAPAGTYHGTVSVKGDGKVVAELPLTVTVHDFTLPNGCPYDMATSFRDHLKQVWDPKMSNERYQALVEDSAAKIAEYKISFDQIYRRTSKDPKSLNLPIAILKRQRDNGQLRSFCILNFDTPKDCVSPDDPRAQECIDDAVAALDYWVPILKREGLLEYGYIYGYDEYTPNYFPLIEKVCAGIKERHPEMPIATTCYDASFGTASCLKSIDIFTPLTPRYDPAIVAKSRAEGRKVWWYICIGPHHPFANWFVEYPAIEARLLMGVMTAKYRPDGFLYYALTRWPENHNPIGRESGPYTDWNPASFQTANGDGSLFCAGPDGILGTIRSENFRDGVEDYCYFLELEKRLAAAPESTPPEILAAAKAALEVPSSVVNSLENYTRDPAEVRAYRRRLLQAIDSLKR